MLRFGIPGFQISESGIPDVRILGLRGQIQAQEARSKLRGQIQALRGQIQDSRVRSRSLGHSYI